MDTFSDMLRALADEVAQEAIDGSRDMHEAFVINKYLNAKAMEAAR